jgi:hypothetical protein
MHYQLIKADTWHGSILVRVGIKHYMQPIMLAIVIIQL